MPRKFLLLLLFVIFACSDPAHDTLHSPSENAPLDMLNENWPFDQAPNTAAITLRRIAFDGSPILYVTHDRDDHGWQFLDMDDADLDDTCMVALGQIKTLDSTVAELGDMPPGWHAWRRTPADPWQRELNPNDPE